VSPRRTLSHAEARRFYDAFGARQDRQGFYEEPALADLLEHLDLGRARSIAELGCGTGRLAARILAERAPPGCRYLGVDLSATMVGLARERLAPFGDRAEVRQGDGPPRIDAGDAGFDRFLATYVLDLLGGDDIRTALAEAHRLLEPGGLLGVAGLARGEGPLSRAVSALWSGVQRVRPAWVGGCRPLDVASRLEAPAWRLRHRRVVAPWGIPSEIVVAERGPAAASRSPAPAPRDA